MTTRAEFLSVIRERLRLPTADHSIRPIVPVPNDPIRYAVDLSELEPVFTAAAAEAGAELVGRPGDELAEVLERVIRTVEPSRAVVSDDPECEGVAAILSRLGVEIVDGGDPAVVATAQLGVTGAAWAVALTGSIVVDSVRAGTRLASLLPETHLALVRASNIVPTPGSLFRALSSRYPDGLPSSLVFVTGPSRSADIELVITIGVHGPRSVLIAIR